MTTTVAEEAHLDDSSRRLGLFSFLLGAAILFHQQQLDDWAIPSIGLAVTVAAVWLMLRPTSVLRLYVLVGTHIVSSVADLPLVVNHWLLLLLAEVGLVVVLVPALVRRDPWPWQAGALYDRIAPYLRVQVVLVYLLAAFAKINTDFFDAELSCGPSLLGDVLTRGPLDLRGDWQAWPAVVSAIAIELILPIALVCRRTRVVAVVGGVLFHLVLAVAGHVPFSGFAMAFYALFAPDDLLGRADLLLAGRPALARALHGVGSAARTAAGQAAAVAGVLAVAVAVDVLDQQPLLMRLALVLFVGYALGLLLAFLACVRAGSPVVHRRGTLRLASALWVVGPALVVANAASPYLGLKTQSTFTMYSNLQTEGDRWNHLVLPEAVQVFGLQDELVTILASSDPAMQEAAESDRRWVVSGLRAWAARHPDASLSYAVGDRRYDIPRVGDDPRLRASLIERKAAHFRDVPPQAGNFCRTEREGAEEQDS